MEALSRLPVDNVVFPKLGIDLTINSEAISIFGFSVKWYGVMIALGMLLAMMYCFRRAKEYGIDGDRLIDAVIAGVIGAVVGARLYYVVLHSASYHSIKDILSIRDGGLAIYGGIIGGLLFGCIMAKIRKLKIMPTLDIVAMGLFIGQCLGRWGNFFNQEAFGCNTTLPWGMYSEATRDYLLSSVVTAPKGTVIDPNLPVHPTFLYESIWCFVGLFLLVKYIKKRKFAGDIALRYLIWYGAGRFWIEALRTDSLLLVPSIGLRVSQVVAAVAVVGGIIAEVILTKRYKDKPLMVKLALNSEGRTLAAKAKKADPAFRLEEEELLASSPRKLFVERTEAYNKRVKEELSAQQQ